MSLSSTLLPPVYIYGGGLNYHGVSFESYNALSTYCGQTMTVSSCTNETLNPSSWPRKAVLIFPGGICKIWEEGLGEDKQKEILEWVEKGGRIFAVCAGGYFTSAQSSYSLQGVVFKRIINLFPGICKGPTFTNSLVVRKIKWLPTGDEGYVAILGGGSFIPDLSISSESRYEPLATYSDITDPSAFAIVKCIRGDGVHIASGAHLEFDSKHIEVFKKVLLENEVKEMQSQLDEGERFRKDCLKEIFQM